MESPPGTTAQRQQVYYKDLHDSSHRSMRTSSTTKNCTQDRRVVCASSPQMSLIQEGFVLRQDLSPYRFHLAGVAKCSCPQHRKLQGLQSLLKAATKSNSLARENLKDEEPRGTYPASSCTHFLQDSCFPCMERQGKRARMYHIMAKWMEEIRLPLSSLLILGGVSMFSLGSVGSKILSLREGLI